MGNLTLKDMGALCRMQKQYAKLYNSECGLLSISDSNVHIREKEFFRFFSEYNERERSSPEYPYEYYAHYNGVKFFCITETRHDGGVNNAEA